LVASYNNLTLEISIMVTGRTGRGKAGGDGLDRKTERIELNLWFSGVLGYHRGGKNAMVGQEES